jgi:hypothetical protein
MNAVTIAAMARGMSSDLALWITIDGPAMPQPPCFGLSRPDFR